MKKINEFEDYSITKEGEIFSHKTNKWLKPIFDCDGYRQITLCKNNKRYTKRMHKLVALTYISNENNLPIINHINGIKTDNRIENLEWCSHSHNNKHAFEFGLKTISNKQKLRISLQGKLRAKIVLNTQTGIFYESLTEAAKLLGYNYKYLAAKIINPNKNNTNLIYV